MHDNDANNDTEKFLFNLNDFSGEALHIAAAEAAAPPSIFNESELEAAKAAAFEEGRKQGTQDSDAAKLRSIQIATQNIGKKVDDLIKNEEVRAKIFENEVISTTLSVFEATFPFYFKNNGFSELKNAIITTLEAQRDLHPLSIHCHADELADLQTHLTENGLSDGAVLSAHADIALGDCEIIWKNGGAVHQMGAVVQKITHLLEQTLEEAGVKRHDIAADGETHDENCDTIKDQGPDISEEQAPNDGDNA